MGGGGEKVPSRYDSGDAADCAPEVHLLQAQVISTCSSLVGSTTGTLSCTFMLSVTQVVSLAIPGTKFAQL